MHSPLDTLHNLIVLSADPEAKHSPFGENSTLKTQDECPVRVFILSPLDTLHTPIVQSLDPDPKYSPFGGNAMLLIPEEWPVSLNREHID